MKGISLVYCAKTRFLAGRAEIVKKEERLNARKPSEDLSAFRNAVPMLDAENSRSSVSPEAD